MKNILIALLAIALSISLLQATAFEKTAKYRTTSVHISADKPLSTGSNNLIFDVIQDTKVTKNAKVSVRAFMPAMPGMPAMEYKTDAKDLGNGKYGANINLSMGGTWQLHIFIINTDGKKYRVKSSLNF